MRSIVKGKEQHHPFVPSPIEGRGKPGATRKPPILILPSSRRGGGRGWWASKGLTPLFNRKAQKSKRQYLRNHMTRAEITLWYSLKGKQLLVPFQMGYPTKTTAQCSFPTSNTFIGC